MRASRYDESGSPRGFVPLHGGRPIQPQNIAAAL